MKIVMFLSVFALMVCVSRLQAGPVVPVLSDEKAEVDSRDSNEVGPEEDWQLFNRMSKTKSFDTSDSDKTRELLKEIEEFSRLVANVTDNPETTMDPMADATDVDSASSDLFASTWRNLIQNDDDGGRASESNPKSEKQDDGNVEDIIRKISNDLKKLYVKIKKVITVVKNWVQNAKGSMNEYEGPFQISASASESDGVYVIADPLIGDVDKSNKYTVPINGE